MLKIPYNLQLKVFNLIKERKDNNKEISLEELKSVFADDFNKYCIGEKLLTKNLRRIKDWYYNPPKKLTSMLTKKQDKCIKQENKIKKQRKEILNNNLQLKNVKTERKLLLQELKGYEEAMYIQKRAITLYKDIKCSFDKDLNVNVNLLEAKNNNYDLLEGVIVLVAMRAMSDLKNGKKSLESVKLLLDMLKENEKATLFMQQYNLNSVNNSNNDDTSMINDLLNKIKEAN